MTGASCLSVPGPPPSSKFDLTATVSNIKNPESFNRMKKGI